MQEDKLLEGEPFGQEALAFTKEMIMQREVRRTRVPMCIHLG